MRVIRRSILFILGVLIISLATAYIKLDLLEYSNLKITNTTVKVEAQILNNKNLEAQQTEYLKQSQSVNSQTNRTIRHRQAIEKLSIADFPLGWYDSIELTKTPAKIAREEINFVIPYVGESNDQIIMAYLDAAEDAGIKVLLEIPRLMVNGGEGEQKMITEFIRTFKSHQSIFGWYLYDEPEIDSQESPYVEPAKLQTIYNNIKAEDPIRPVAIVFGHLQKIKDYKNALDILMFNRYPCLYEEPEFGGEAWRKYRETVNIAAANAKNKLAFWNVIQAFGEDSNGVPQGNGRLPTAAEERYMFYTSILASADGIFFWTHYRSQQTWIDSVLTPILKDFEQYIPAIKSGSLTEKVTVSRKDIQASIYQYPDSKSYVLIAIHHGLGEVQATIKLNPSVFNNSTVVKENNRSLELTTVGTFNDNFTPYEVHIYSIKS